MSEQKTLGGVFFLAIPENTLELIKDISEKTGIPYVEVISESIKEMWILKIKGNSK